MRLLLPLLALSACGGPPCEPTDGNLLADGGFDEGLDCWEVAGEGRFELVDEAPPGGTAPSMRIEAPPAGEDALAVRLVSTGFDVEYTEPLIVAFRARSTEVRTLFVRIEKGGVEGDPGWQRAYTYRAPLSPAWESFELSLAASDSITDVPLQFHLGSPSAAPVWIDDVRVERDPQD